MLKFVVYHKNVKFLNLTIKSWDFQPDFFPTRLFYVQAYGLTVLSVA